MSGPRVLLFGADGNTPIAFEEDSDELSRAKALLIECFGAFLGFQAKTGEWPNPQRARMNLLNAITKLVTPQVLMERFEAAGLEILTPEQERAAQLAEVEKVRSAAASIDQNLGRPFRAVPGGKA